MIGTVRLALVACLLIATLAAPASAEDRAAARQAFSDGSKYYDLHQFTEALEAFKRAYWNYEDPMILYNIAQCHRALKHKPEAIDFYRTYLRKAPDARNREEVQRIIGELDSIIAREKVVAASAPQGTITDAKPVVSAPTEPDPTPVASSVAVVKPQDAPGPARKRTWIWGVVAGVVVVGVGLGVGLALGLQPHAPTAVDGSVRF